MDVTTYLDEHVKMSEELLEADSAVGRAVKAASARPTRATICALEEAQNYYALLVQERAFMAGLAVGLCPDSLHGIKIELPDC